MTVKILVAHHKQGYLYDNKIHKSIHVGKSTSNIDLMTLNDNLGNNISYLNPYYCELTATYWAWKNVRTDYIGICHYRRYFWHKNIFSSTFILTKLKYKIKVFLNFFQKRNFKVIFFSQLIINNNVKKGYIDKFSSWLEKDILKNSIDIYSLNPSKNVGMSNQENFCVFGENYLEQLKQIIEDEYVDYSFFLNQTLSSKELHYGNMIIMKRDIFDEYSNFIFGVLEKHYKLNYNEIDNGGYKRISGYMAEILTNSFVLKKKKQRLKIKYLNGLYIK